MTMISFDKTTKSKFLVVDGVEVQVFHRPGRFETQKLSVSIRMGSEDMVVVDTWDSSELDADIADLVSVMKEARRIGERYPVVAFDEAD